MLVRLACAMERPAPLRAIPPPETKAVHERMVQSTNDTTTPRERGGGMLTKMPPPLCAREGERVRVMGFVRRARATLNPGRTSRRAQQQPTPAAAPSHRLARRARACARRTRRAGAPAAPRLKDAPRPRSHSRDAHTVAKFARPIMVGAPRDSTTLPRSRVSGKVRGGRRTDPAEQLEMVDAPASDTSPLW